MVFPPIWLSAASMMVNQSIVLLITSYIIYQIARSHRKKANDTESVFYTAMTFMICNWLLTLHLIVAAAFNMFRFIRFGVAHEMSVSEFTVLNTIAAFLFLLQNYLLLIAFFSRLSNLFKAGPLRISKWITSMYKAALSLIPALCLCIPISRALGGGKIWQRILSLTVIFLAISVLCSLLAMFHFKLKQIQKNKTLSAFIHRQMILAALTVISNILFFGVTAARSAIAGENDDRSVGNRWMAFAESFIISFHIICNFLTVALSYRCCDSLLVLCCGCLRCCNLIPITTADHDAIFLEQIMKNTKTQNAAAPKSFEHGPTPRTLPGPTVGTLPGSTVGTLPGPTSLSANPAFMNVYEY